MLYDLWRTIAAQRRHVVAVHDLASGQRWTFGNLFTAGEAIEVGRSDLVFPQGHSAEFILAILAAWRTGKVVCPLEPGQTPPSRARHSVRASRPVATPGAHGVTRPTEIVHLKITSATTGTARLVSFTAKQLAADAENIVATMGLRPNRPNLGVISLAHSYGFSNLVTPLLLHGIPLILAPSPLPEAIRRAAQGEPELTLPAVPAMWRAWHDVDAIPSNIKLAISAGAPLPLALEQEVFARHGLKIHNFYGASECGGIAYDVTETPRTDAADVGVPMKNVSLSVADDGCLEVRGLAVAQAYWPQPCACLTGGCFHTSDLAEISGGHVFLRGRAGDQINVAGRKVSPETIEQALLKHPQVSECLVFGVPSRDAKRTEEIVAVVVSSEREPSLRQFILETLPAWQTPRHWWFVESLAANERGKISRAEWRKQYLQRNEEHHNPESYVLAAL